MRGCTLEETNDTHTTCHCDHLTHFAILIQDRDQVVRMIGYSDVARETPPSSYNRKKKTVKGTKEERK